MRHILRDLVFQRGKTVVAVTHDIGLAERMTRVHLVDAMISADTVSAGVL